eukprot:3083770-Heterocapsa_arctica.AAC.1
MTSFILQLLPKRLALKAFLPRRAGTMNSSSSELGRERVARTSVFVEQSFVSSALNSVGEHAGT